MAVKERVPAVDVIHRNGGSVVTMILTLPKQPTATTGGGRAPTASLATARALGDSARSRLDAAGQAATAAACVDAYAADSAASPLLLPAPGRSSVIQGGYV